MHSIAVPFSPAFLTISSFIASPTPCCPLLPLTKLESPLKNAVCRCRNFESFVRFGLLQSDDVTTLCSTGSQQGVDMTDTVDAVDRCCVNVECTERELLQPRPRPGGLVFLAGGLPLRLLPRRFFLANALCLSLSSWCFLPRFLLSFSRRVGCGNPTAPRILHRRHFCLRACALRAFHLSSLRVPLFPRRRCPNFATAGTVAAGNDFTLLGFITASRCCWQACTVSIDEFSHQSMP